jgi:hypothetical protein
MIHLGKPLIFPKDASFMWRMVGRANNTLTWREEAAHIHMINGRHVEVVLRPADWPRKWMIAKTIAWLVIAHFSSSSALILAISLLVTKVLVHRILDITPIPDHPRLGCAFKKFRQATQSADCVIYEDGMTIRFDNLYERTSQSPTFSGRICEKMADRNGIGKVRIGLFDRKTLELISGIQLSALNWKWVKQKVNNRIVDTAKIEITARTMWELSQNRLLI